MKKHQKRFKKPTLKQLEKIGHKELVQMLDKLPEINKTKKAGKNEK